MARYLLTVIFAICSLCAIAVFYATSKSEGLGILPKKVALADDSYPQLITRKTVKTISIQNSDGEMHYQRTGTQWDQVAGKISVRADYRKIEKLLFLIESSKIISHTQNSPEDLPSSIIKLTSEDGAESTVTLFSNLPFFTGEEAEFPCFILNLGDQYYYTCTSLLDEKIPALTKESLKDHRPFFFHPSLTSEVSWTNATNTITISKAGLKSPWEITAPLNLRGDQEKITKIIQDLYELEAAKTATLPETLETKTITVKGFSNSFSDQILQIGNNGISKTPALPYGLSFTKNQIPLPLVDELRAKNISSISIANIQEVLLQSKYQSFPVTLSIKKTSTGKPRWVYQTLNKWHPANETNVADLISAFIKDPVAGFSLDTIPVDLEPDKSVTFHLKNGESLSYDIAILSNGIVLQEKGASSSFLLSGEHYEKVRTAQHDWKDSLLWKVSPITLKGLQRSITGQKTENFSYSYNTEKWKGQVGEATVDSEIDNVAANAYLTFLEGIKVKQWLPASHPLIKTKGAPEVSLLALSELYSDEGDSLGFAPQSLTVSPLGDSKFIKLAELKGVNGITEFALVENSVADQLKTPLVYQD